MDDTAPLKAKWERNENLGQLFNRGLALTGFRTTGTRCHQQYQRDSFSTPNNPKYCMGEYIREESR